MAGSDILCCTGQITDSPPAHVKQIFLIQEDLACSGFRDRNTSIFRYRNTECDFLRILQNCLQNMILNRCESGESVKYDHTSANHLRLCYGIRQHIHKLLIG